MVVWHAVLLFVVIATFVMNFGSKTYFYELIESLTSTLNGLCAQHSLQTVAGPVVVVVVTDVVIVG